MSHCVKESIQQIDQDSWLVGNTTVLRRTRTAENFLWHDIQSGYYYTLNEVNQSPPTYQLPPDSYITLVHESADVSAVWDLGNAYLKVKRFQDRGQATSENATLNWLSTKDITFNIPKALYYKKEDDRSYLISSRVPGLTLEKAWTDLSEDEKEYYVTSVANVCKEMMDWTSNTISGVDGGQLPDPWLSPYCNPSDYRPETLETNCKQLGLQITADSIFVFFHNDLAPGNIIINPGQDKIGIIDWEMAGFVPWEWICTKFWVCWGMDSNDTDHDPEDWRLRVARRLGQDGFPEFTEAWKIWSNSRLPQRSVI